MQRVVGKFLEYNQHWACEKHAEDPHFFEHLAEGQNPIALLLGCSDSRVSPSVVLGGNLGEIFIHRNIANVVSHADMNFLSVLQYAVEVLGIQDITSSTSSARSNIVLLYSEGSNPAVFIHHGLKIGKTRLVLAALQR